MQRQVECQSKVLVRTEGTGATPPFDEANYETIGGMLTAKPEAVAPDIIKDEVVLLFYDQHPSAHRNAIQLVLTPEEAAKFEVDKVYTLSIS